MKRIALVFSAAPILGACNDNGQTYCLKSINLKKDYIGCKNRDFIKLIASNYGNQKGFDELIRIGQKSKNCRIFKKGEKVIVSISRHTGKIETIDGSTALMHYATFDPVD